METIFKEIRDQVRKINDKYLLMYFIACNNNKTQEAAEAFVKQYYEKFSKDITRVSMEAIQKYAAEATLADEILKENGLSIIQLKDRILGRVA